ncbi:hypothetical protein R1sor_022348 [Riccia sorocarpa]|uniref:Cytochrome P450 n=1 Tax=Riccia sorocarpa TaxID=122646 RepID=A0ABD3GLK4_9MARC
MASIVTYTMAGGTWNRLPLSYTTPIIVSVSILVTIGVWFIGSYIQTRRQIRLPVPPGSYGLPWIGDTMNFMASSMSAVGYQKWIESKRRKYGALFKIRFLGNPLVLMEAPAGNKFLFQKEGKKQIDIYWPPQVARLFGRKAILNLGGEEHRVARRYVARFLDYTAVSRYVETVERRTVQHFADHWEKEEIRGSESDTFVIAALDKTKLFTFSVMCSLVISMDEGPEMEVLLGKFNTWARGFISLPINLPGFSFYNALKARSYILDLFSTHIAQRTAQLAKDRPGASKTAAPDILTSLLTVADENGELFSETKIKDNLLTLLFGGFDTSSTALTMIIYYIAKYPRVYDQLLQEHRSILEQKRRKGDDEALIMTREDLSSMKYTWRVIQEALRLQPPLTGGWRRATTDLEYNGYSIPKGWTMMWNNMNSHFDPKFFHDPTTFNPSRFEEPSTITPFTFLPFGAGTRFCPGNEFAKMEMLIFIHHLIKRYQWTLVDPDDPVIRDPMPMQRNRTLIKVTRRIL